MTVAAVILAGDLEEAMGDAAGRPAVRRIVDAGWAGGAMPLIVVVTDAGAVAAALGGTPAQVTASPASGSLPGGGATAHALAGSRAACASVVETSAVLLWPVRMAWVDPETVTSLIEGHGAWPGEVLRPAWSGAAGWPVLVPVASLETLSAPGRPADAGGVPAGRSLEDVLAAVPARILELGDPGVSMDRSVPLAALPDYEGPAAPVSGPPPDWGAAAADRPAEEEGLVGS
jgi:hypothetical protein